jgi:hypothetical protein
MPSSNVVVVLALIAGTIAGTASARVEDADQQSVAECTFVKDVSAPTQNGRYTRAAIGAAMEQARDQAAKAGATHVVWEKIHGANVSTVAGKAYRCDR